MFTTKNIKIGEYPFVGVRDDSRKIKTVTRNQQRYCIWDKEKRYWWGPKNFNHMVIWWYLNHSKSPNISTKTWKSIKNIKAGKELVIDYREFKES